MTLRSLPSCDSFASLTWPAPSAFPCQPGAVIPPPADGAVRFLTLGSDHRGASTAMATASAEPYMRRMVCPFLSLWQNEPAVAPGRTMSICRGRPRNVRTVVFLQTLRPGFCLAGASTRPSDGRLPNFVRFRTLTRKPDRWFDEAQGSNHPTVTFSRYAMLWGIWGADRHSRPRRSTRPLRPSRRSQHRRHVDLSRTDGHVRVGRADRGADLDRNPFFKSFRWRLATRDL